MRRKVSLPVYINRLKKRVGTGEISKTTALRMLNSKTATIKRCRNAFFRQEKLIEKERKILKKMKRRK